MGITRQVVENILNISCQNQLKHNCHVSINGPFATLSHILNKGDWHNGSLATNIAVMGADQVEDEIVMSTSAMQEVELDSRQRLPLAKVVQGSQRRFRVERLPSGEYLLTPVVSISERELAVLKDREVMNKIEEGVRQAAAGEVVRYEVGFFNQLVKDDGVDE
ncbi:MAG TPA: hypothetical protein VIJ40_02065 [Acidimicrobiales bacterium]